MSQNGLFAGFLNFQSRSFASLRNFSRGIFTGHHHFLYRGVFGFLFLALCIGNSGGGFFLYLSQAFLSRFLSVAHLLSVLLPRVFQLGFNFGYLCGCFCLSGFHFISGALAGSSYLLCRLLTHFGFGGLCFGHGVGAFFLYFFNFVQGTLASGSHFIGNGFAFGLALLARLCYFRSFLPVDFLNTQGSLPTRLCHRLCGLLPGGFGLLLPFLFLFSYLLFNLSHLFGGALARFGHFAGGGFFFGRGAFGNCRGFSGCVLPGQGDFLGAFSAGFCYFNGNAFFFQYSIFTRAGYLGGGLFFGAQNERRCSFAAFGHLLHRGA